ncbi:DUF4221 family protein [Thermoflexibacter ruber]|uniref:DUF4221 domain-containing protein n=1 Tax=Thermoflexibacter ruber TaxID=1003 RepID=A0A1I2FXF5_9BACT|nr:DUF4221 family protein [Thermoflexibacter ruber]SFF09380.1 protein of unknown function [Thermoflexibacter ruber]
MILTSIKKPLYIGLINILLVFCICCTDKHAEQQAHSTANKAIEFVIDSITISTDSTFLSFYDTYSVINVAGKPTFYGYNHKRHSIDILSLEGNDQRNRIVLQKEGPDGIDDLYSIHVQSPDSIFISTQTSFYLVSSEGRLLNKWNVEADNIAFFSKNALHITAETPISYDSHNKIIYAKIVPYDRNISGQKTYRMPILGKYNLNNKTFTALPVYFPKAYQEEYKGFLDKVKMSNSYHKGRLKRIYFTFGAMSSLAYYDVEKEKYLLTDAPSIITDNEAPSLAWSDANNIDKKMRHFINNVFFGNTVYEAGIGIGFRLHLDKLPSNVTDLRNAALKRKLILTAFDSSHHILKEVDFPIRNVAREFAFVANGRLYLPMWSINPKDEDENKLKFLILNVKYEESN